MTRQSPANTTRTRQDEYCREHTRWLARYARHGNERRGSDSQAEAAQHRTPPNNDLLRDEKSAVLCNGPDAEVSEELCEGGGLIVGIEATGVGEDPGVAAAEKGILAADAGVFDAGDDAVGTDADERDDGGAPALDFGFKALAAGAKFVVGKFIGAGRGPFDDVGDAEFEVEKKGTLKRGEEARGEAAAVERGPKAVAGAAEVTADGGCVKAGVNAGEENDEVFGDQIRDALAVCGE